MRRRGTARGFTLLELLVVLGIIVVLASIAIVVTLRMQERDQVPRTATLLQGGLASAKIRAAAERTNIGIRLVLRINKGEAPTLTDADGDGTYTRFDVGDLNANGTPQEWADVATLIDSTDNDQNGWFDDLILCDAVEFIRDPGDFTDGTVQTEYRWEGATPAPVPYSQWLLLRRSDYVTLGPGSPLELQDLARFVLPGDWIELNGLGQLYQILAVDRWDDPNDNPDRGLYQRILLDRAVNPLLGDPYQSPTTSYRIIRQPRPIPGEKPIQLASGAVLDLRWSQLAASGNNFDILFSPSGRVVGTSSAQDMIFLWVHDARTVTDNEVLVTVYPKTGAVLVFPVDRTSGDMYSYARTGRAANTP